MSEKTLILIVIAYNEEKHIDQILDSLAEQTFKDFEIIIIDSNSCSSSKRNKYGSTT